MFQVYSFFTFLYILLHCTFLSNQSEAISNPHFVPQLKDISLFLIWPDAISFFINLRRILQKNTYVSLKQQTVQIKWLLSKYDCFDNEINSILTYCMDLHICPSRSPHRSRLEPHWSFSVTKQMRGNL